MKSNDSGFFNGMGILLVLLIATIAAVFYGHIKTLEQKYEIINVFFKFEGLSPDLYIDSIDLKRAVRLYTIKKGDVVIQYQTPNSPQGNFYAFPGTKPSELGISDTGFDPKIKNIVKKEIRKYRAVNNVHTLASYAKPIKDTWSIPGKQTKTTGYKIQLITSCKECFERIK